MILVCRSLQLRTAFNIRHKHKREEKTQKHKGSLTLMNLFTRLS